MNIAQSIIKDNIYLTLGTCEAGKPWVAPLFYCHDSQNNLYFASQLTSLHTKHVLKNKNVAFTIFDSHQKEGTGNGIQGKGIVKILDTRSQILEALKYYKTSFFKMSLENFTGKAKYRLFKIQPQKFWIQDMESKVDKRVEVQL